MFSFKTQVIDDDEKALQDFFSAQSSQFLASFPAIAEEFDISEKSLQLFYQSRFKYDVIKKEIAADKAVDESFREEVSKQRDVDELQHISLEEKLSIIEKLKALVQQPSGILDIETELYLAQQLTDMLGVEVTPTLNDIHLPHTIASVQAGNYLPKQIDDNNSFHNTYPPVSKKRGFFGWAEEKDQNSKQYFVSLPLLILKNNEFLEDLSWFYKKKVLIVNPHRNKACVASISNCTAQNTTEYQCIASPDIIREAELWSPQSEGKALLFFVDDSKGNVPLGVTSIDYTTSISEK